MALLDKESIFEMDHNGEPHMLTYDGAIDNDMIAVLKESATNDRWYENIAKRLGLDAKYVQLIQHCLAHLDLVEYGTSPRGAWITDRGKKYLEFIEQNLNKREGV
jgi:predicted transcriptional regulator